MTGRYAFFDLDGTLLAEKSMLGFWQHWSALVAREGRTPPALRTTGADRETLNRAYFAHFAGVPLERFRTAARQWYAHYRRRPDAYVARPLDALARHRALGHEVVLVTGSGAALVEPVAEDLGVHRVLATEQLTDAEGTLTGEVRRSMLGAAKQEAVAELTERAGARAEDCFAYGDHASDLPMLSLVGHAVVVGDDPVLAARAAASGWRSLPAHRGPHPGGATVPGKNTFERVCYSRAPETRGDRADAVTGHLPRAGHRTNGPGA
ncbi:HAD family hydrolase [Streptomyces naganishii]|uniref:HAD-IB family hydrolase n=1 Tax=Streptomyces naganishii JCM 4654 TaxID=1306179 RepID=A0A918Y821_9ACTN|nr:HAD-IB family hydrolase [Streptomyces naganishii]GHD93263.1 hypothetical protein GCM10010508_49250 [Streptomyces naganishii JCM 4654]